MATDDAAPTAPPATTIAEHSLTEAKPNAKRAAELERLIRVRCAKEHNL